MRKMPYNVLDSERRVIAICDTFREALSHIPFNSETAQIFDENNEHVFFFKRGKPNGTLDNK